MLFSPRHLFVAILFVALYVMAAREIADPDFWWHLRTGQYIVETGSIPRVDIFSFTNSGRPWVAHEWLSEVLMYLLFALGSFPALILAFALIVPLVFAFVYVQSTGQPYIAAFAVLTAALASAPTWGVRPQMISLLMTALFMFILERWRQKRGREEPGREAWLLAPLTLVWVNLHSGFATGLALTAIYLTGGIAEHLIARQTAPTISRLSTAALRQLGAVFFVSLAVVLINPHGATMYVYPFETLTSHAMQTYIQEWFSPDFHLAEFQPFAWLLLLTLAAAALSGKRTSLTQTLVVAGLGYAALRSARLIPIFALAAAPILAEHLQSIVESRGWAGILAPSGLRPTRNQSILNALLLLGILAASIARVSTVVSNQGAIERARFPAAAVDFLQDRGIGGPLYNSYAWGGYLIWRRYPTARVFIDGRADVYGDAFIEEFLKSYRGGTDWQEALERFGVRAVLVEPDAPLASQLARDARWRKVYEDTRAVVWTR